MYKVNMKIIVSAVLILSTMFNGISARSVSLEKVERKQKLGDLSRDDEESTIVNIPDPILKGYLRKHLEIAPSAEITIQDMLTITAFSIPENLAKKVTSLEGLQYAKNMNALNISNSLVTDITPIADLPIQDLVLRRCRNISNDSVSVIAGFDSLKNVDVSYTKITDLTFVEGKTTLRSLMAIGVGLTDSDIEPLRNSTSLYSIELMSNKITDLSVFKNYPFILILNIWQNEIEDLSPLRNYVGLVKSINLSWNKISDVSPLNTVSSIEYIGLMNNKISDISSLTEKSSNFTNLTLASQDVNIGDFYFKSGEDPKLTNPIIGLNEVAIQPTVGSISSNGTYDEKTNQLSWENQNDNNLYLTWKFDTFGIENDNPRIQEFSGNVKANAKLSTKVLINVKYLDTNGNKIHDDINVLRYPGSAYDVTTSEFKLDIPNYTLDQSKMPENAIGIVQNDAIEVFYIYQKNEPIIPSVTVNVKYVDANGVTIAPSKQISGKIGDVYDASTAFFVIDIEGYELRPERIPENITGVLASDTEDIVLVYTKKQSKEVTITVKYLDTNGNKIHDDINVLRYPGSAYDVTTSEFRLDIPNYTLDQSKMPENAIGIVQNDAIEVFYIYQKDEPIIPSVTVNVKYVDTNGVTIAPSKQISGKTGDAYDASIAFFVIDIEGYELRLEGIPENITGVLASDTEDIVLVYTKKQQSKEVTITVKYMDTNGNKIHDDINVLGYPGSAYDVTTSEYKLDIPNYTLDQSKMPENAIGIVQKDAIEVFYIYQKDEPIIPSVTVNVKYLDTNGVALAPSKQISGKIGESYDASTGYFVLEISGYELKPEGIPQNITGVLAEDTEDIVFVYTKVVPKEITEKKLPQTGKSEIEIKGLRNMGYILIAVGCIILYISSINKRRKRL